jgi:hypothetical protein
VHCSRQTKTTTARLRRNRHQVAPVVPSGYRIENGTYIHPETSVKADDRLVCGIDGCTFWMKAHYIVGTVKTTVRCDARCEDATGTKCECECGGKQHGMGEAA